MLMNMELDESEDAEMEDEVCKVQELSLADVPGTDDSICDGTIFFITRFLFYILRYHLLIAANKYIA